jgi:hypothetical protein
VSKQLQLAANDPSLVNISEKALTLRDSFDSEINESISAAQTLMENFGLSSDQAFDFIASGFQRGLNRSDDFIDTINEYSTQFSNGGASAAQFFSLLETGLQGGVLGTDKAADAFKEFRLRIQDGSKTTEDGLKLLGLNSAAITRDLASGSITVTQAWEMVTGALRQTDDAAIRMQAGVALIGTQYEDLGDAAVAAIDMSRVSLDDLSGATDKLSAKYDTLGNFFSGLWRRATVALSPLTDGILEIGNMAMPTIESAFTKIESAITSAIGRARELYGVMRGSGVGPVPAAIGALAIGAGAQVSYDATTKIVSVDWGDFTFEYDTKSRVLSVDWTTESGEGIGFVYDAEAGIKKINWNAGDGGFQWQYDAEAGITNVDWGLGQYFHSYSAGVTINNVLWGLFYGHYTADTGITSVLWGLFSHRYNSDVTIVGVLWGLFTGTYSSTASISSVVWGVYSFVYDGKVAIEKVLWGAYSGRYTANTVIKNVLWGAFRNEYTAKSRVVDVLWGIYHWEYEADVSITSVFWGVATKTYDVAARATIGSVLWGLFTYTYDAKGRITEFSWDENILKSIGLGFTDMEAPAWLQPLLSWLFPDPPSTVEDLVSWTFPEFSEGLLSTWNLIFAWSFPGFSGELSAIWNRIFAWKFPDAPGWISSLLNWSPGTPAWVSSLLSWSPSLPSLPSWLGGGGGGDSASEPKAKDGRSGVSSGATVNVYVQNVNNNMDVEQIAYTIQRRLAGV